MNKMARVHVRLTRRLIWLHLPCRSLGVVFNPHAGEQERNVRCILVPYLDPETLLLALRQRVPNIIIIPTAISTVNLISKDGIGAEPPQFDGPQGPNLACRRIGRLQADLYTSNHVAHQGVTKAAAQDFESGGRQLLRANVEGRDSVGREGRIEEGRRRFIIVGGGGRVGAWTGHVGDH